MFCVVGLGNPGTEYSDTRHNVGFRVLDDLAAATGTSIRRSEYRALTATVRICRTEVLLLKPQTYMNHSGASWRAAAKSEALDPERTVVVYDDVDLELGRLRLRRGGSSGGHRGIESLITEIGSPDFVRCRVGIGRPAEGGDAADYVLSPFEPEEQPLVDAQIARAVDAVRTLICRDLTVAMNEFNVAPDAPATA